MGGDARRYNFWNGFDLSTKKGTDDLIDDLLIQRPRHVFLSPPCGPERQMQNANQRSAQQVVDLGRKRYKVRRIQRSIEKMLNVVD
jgi:hypothetical protein